MYNKTPKGGCTMQYLSELITENTPILNLKNDRGTTNEEKETVLGKIRTGRARKEAYLKMMYLMNNSWYYFKNESGNAGYPFHLINELMGAYLTKSRDLKPLDFLVAKTKQDIGLASLNFKKEGYDYYFGDYFQRLYEQKTGQCHDLSVDSVDRLSILCPNMENAAKLIDDFLNMLAIDLYMLQTDRGPANIQFAINRQTQETELAHIYDLSNCSKEIASSGIFLKDCIICLHDLSIIALAKRYPEFCEYLSFLIEQGFVSIWNKICDDYHFNKENEAYEQVLEYFQTKEEKQKKYLYNLLGKKLI